MVEGMRGFGCASVFGKLVAWKGKPTVVIERVGRRGIDILLVMDLPSSQSGKERAFRDAIGVEVGETGHGLT